MHWIVLKNGLFVKSYAASIRLGVVRKFARSIALVYPFDKVIIVKHVMDVDVTCAEVERSIKEGV